MMVNTATRIATVDIFFTSRNAALIEHKMSPYLTLTDKLPYYTFFQPKIHVFTLSKVLFVPQYIAGTKTALKPGVFNKI